ncbi:TerD family protein [Rapidithrix thailandica]|uniref:TerD family protein n=1 Tax=Rapidithrix thailandica TaxID=413964 RepID=A0AAW9SL34_9BACT
MKIIFMAELANLGYKITNPDLYTDAVLEDFEKTMEVLKKMKGGDKKYVPLFQGFPDLLPNQEEYWHKRLAGYLGNVFGQFTGKERLNNGMIIPDWLFDLEEFGADPISQFQDKGLFEKGVLRQLKKAKDTHTEWVEIKFVSQKEAMHQAWQFLLNNVYAKSSIKEALKPEIEFLLEFFGADGMEASRVVFKETKAYLMQYCWKQNDLKTLAQFIDTPTDLLRLFAAVTESDTSLAQPIKFPKLKRAQRVFVMQMLEKCPDLAENLKAYKGLWLALGRYLHPFEYAKKFPNTYAAFDLLRNGKVVTFNAKVEQSIQASDLDNLLALLVQRPGMFARKIHHVLEISKKEYLKVLAAFDAVVDQVALKNLLVMDAYFQTIEAASYRTIINKKGKIRVMDNTPNRLEKAALEALKQILQKAIAQKISSEKESWEKQKVWIDPALRNFTVPLQQRSASDGLLTLGRGSRMPLEEGKVLRLFVYWKENDRRTDLDLSLIQYDEEMKFKGQVSYTNLEAGGILHSGDLQSAPCGAAEFIDIELDTLRERYKEVRYIATQVYRYSGNKFADMDCHSGWMIREKVNNKYKSFDIKTVQHKFDLKGSGSYAIPILIDLHKQEIIFIDLYINSLSGYNRVEGAYQDISTISKQMTEMYDTRPNMLALARYHSVGRNAAITEEKSEADITFGLSDCDYNVSDIELILNELL